MNRREDRVVWFDPFDVKIVGFDTNSNSDHEYFSEYSNNLPIDKNLAFDIKSNGQKEAILITRSRCVIDGRKRVRAIRYLNSRKGSHLKVLAYVKRTTKKKGTKTPGLPKWFIRELLLDDDFCKKISFETRSLLEVVGGNKRYSGFVPGLQKRMKERGVF